MLSHELAFGIGGDDFSQPSADDLVDLELTETARVFEPCLLEVEEPVVGDWCVCDAASALVVVRHGLVDAREEGRVAEDAAGVEGDDGFGEVWEVGDCPSCERGG